MRDAGDEYIYSNKIEFLLFFYSDDSIPMPYYFLLMICYGEFSLLMHNVNIINILILYIHA